VIDCVYLLLDFLLGDLGLENLPSAARSRVSALFLRDGYRIDPLALGLLRFSFQRAMLSARVRGDGDGLTLFFFVVVN
tara:strand:- start:33 stop:266 length:234 start_codon:yes stop_codon:yes gene_type:complete